MKKKFIQITFVFSILSLFIVSGCANSTPVKNKYTVTFKDYDGTVLRTEKIEEGHNATAPNDPTRYGYIFLGWDNEYTNIQKDTILVAQYERDENIIFEYKVTFIDYDGTILKEEIVEEGSNATAPSNLEREGYIFVGWDQEYTNIKNDLDVFAKYDTIKYSIKYELNEGTLKKENPSEYSIEDSFELKKPLKDGFTFEGWYTNPEFTGSKVESILKGTTGNIELYAKYNAIEYNITYKLDDGTNNSINPNEYTVLDEIILEAPTKEGYKFIGWELNGTIIQSIHKGTIGNLVLQAKWQINKYTITFDTDGGSNIDSITQDYNTEIVKPADPTKEGYTFVGWDKEIPTTMPAENIIIKALWGIGEYFIKFDTDGGTRINTIVQDYNTEIVKPADPTKEGYTFVGWDQEIPTNMPASNLVIKAIWKINTYNITFDLDGGSTNNPTTYTVVDKFTLINPTKEGYKFIGWTSDTISEPILNVIFECETGNKHFVANYTQVIFTITFDSNGGTNIESIEYSIESDEFILPKPTKERYVFLGWYDAEDNKIEKIEKTTLKDIELVAKWERKVTEGLEYCLNTDKTYYILTGLGKVKDTDIVIPSTYNELPVKSIVQHVFSQYANLTCIEIPASVTYIGSSAFNGCTSLENVYYNGTIEDWCKISFSTSSSNPMYYAENCYVLNEKQEYYEVTDENNSIDLKIPETVTSISTYHFYKMVAIKSVVLGDNVTSIGYRAFSGCTGLTSIEIPNSVTSIDIFAFENCKSLTSIKIPNSVTSIGSYTFSYCTSLTSIEIPNSVTSIGKYSFSHCTSLTSIKIPNSVTSIGPFAFYNCTSLESVYYNGTIEDWCNISIDSLISNPMYYAKHMYMLNENNEYYEVTDANNEVDLVIPSDVIKIGKSQFYKMSALKSVTIRNSVTSIGYSAFEGCTSLTNIIIPNSVTSIESYAFEDCDNLTIYCEAKSQLENWDSKWNSENCPVEWGYVNIKVYEENGYKYINFGRYPQTVVTDETTISALSSISTTNNLGYIEYNGNEYKKSVATPYNTGYTFSNGNNIVEGSIYYFLVEPIKWRVLEENDGTYKLLSEMILDNSEFYGYETNRIINEQTIYANNYEYSNIRAWLNGYDGSSYNVNNYNGNGFLNIAFSDEELEIVYNSFINNNLSNNTIDKIYLLSNEDTLNTNYGFNNKYNDTDPLKIANVTDFSLNKKCYMNSTEYGGYWWLRTSNVDSNNQSYISGYYGSNLSTGTVNLLSIGIRPAITISTNDSKDYQVIFKDYNGNPLKIEEVNSGDNATPPTDPSREYYNFIGWNKEYTNVQGDLEVQALYEPIIYTITFDTDGGNVINYLDFTIETQNLTLPTPIKEGYEFKGWYENDVLVETVELKDYSLLAKWKEIQSLEFELSSDETYYIVVGIGNVTDTDIVIPSTYKELPVKGIGDNAFKKNTTLTNINISESVTSIGKMAFYGCNSLESIEFKENSQLINIDGYAFYDCTNLKNISIPYGVKTIQQFTFYGCNSLESIELPSSLTSIRYVYDGTLSTTGSNAFTDCTSLEKVFYKGTIEEWCGINFDNYNSTPMHYASSFYMLNENNEYYEVTELVIPETVTTINSYQFYGFKNVTNVKINEGVNSIGSYAFESCSQLVELKIPNSITTIQENTFDNCGYLFDVYYDGTIENWFNISFKITYTLGATVQYKMTSSNPMYYAENLYVLKNNEYYKVENLQYNVPESMTIITNQFAGYKFLTSIFIPLTVTNVGNSSFAECTNLTIYCEAESKPEDWDSKWNSSNCPVIWGFKIYEENGYTYVNLGRYPQTVITDEATITELSNISIENDLGYIEYDGNEYKKVVAAPYYSDYTFSNGNKITKGNTYYFKVEPIKWIVLENNDGSYKLLSKIIVDKTSFYTTSNTRTLDGQKVYSNNYEYSNIRAWLNGYDGSSYDVDNYTNKGFLDIAFTEEEKLLVNSTLVDNSLSSTGDSSNSYICNNTTDKIYLLSLKDAFNENYGFLNDEYIADNLKKALGSDYVRSKGLYMSLPFSKNGYWWLRTPYYIVSESGGDSIPTRIVTSGGDISGEILYKYNTSIGVRPAMTITIK